jgi:hypothetical protein
VEEVRPRDRQGRIINLNRQLRFHQERRKMVETDPELTAEDRTRKLTYHHWVIDRLRGQLIDVEGR